MNRMLITFSKRWPSSASALPRPSPGVSAQSRGFAKATPKKSPGRPKSAKDFGMHKVDYSTPPPAWPLPPNPPAPKGLRRFVFPVSAVMTVYLFVWIYMNPEDDIQEYWKQVDSGNVPLDMLDDDDDDDDDFDDDDDDDE